MNNNRHKERVSRRSFTLTPVPERVPWSSDRSITPRSRDTSEEPSRKFFTTPVEVPLSARSNSWTLTDTNGTMNCSSVPKVCTVDSSSTAGRRPVLPAVTSCPWHRSPREPSSATSKPNEVIVVLSLVAPVPTPLLSPTTKTREPPSFDFHPEVRRPSLPASVLKSELLPEEVVPTSPCWRPDVPTTSMPSSVTAGQRFVVWQKIP